MRGAAMKTKDTPKQYVIYSRKSKFTGKGESIENQIELCRQYIAMRFDEEFGEKAELPPSNLVDEKQFELRTPSVVIKVDPEHSDLVETRIINGCRYILIDASEGVEVNGVNIQIEE